MTIDLLGIPSLVISISIILLIVALLIRAFASWFGFDERFAFIRFLARMTDPLLEPLRRVAPPIRSIDISYIVVFFLLVIMRYLLLQAMPTFW
jgi:YggT family protein